MIVNVPERLAELMSAGYLVTNRSDYYVWVDYHGHVDKVSVRVAYKSDCSVRLFDDYIHVDLEKSPEKVVEKIDGWLRKLEVYGNAGAEFVDMGAAI